MIIRGTYAFDLHLHNQIVRIDFKGIMTISSVVYIRVLSTETVLIPVLVCFLSLTAHHVNVFGLLPGAELFHSTWYQKLFVAYHWLCYNYIRHAVLQTIIMRTYCWRKRRYHTKYGLALFNTVYQLIKFLTLHFGGPQNRYNTIENKDRWRS